MSTILAIFAHPDDEAMGPGGTLAKLAQTSDVYLVCCTDGNHGAKGLKSIRSQELLASTKILGIKEVIFLDFVDGDLSNNLYHPLVTALQPIVARLQPQTLLTFHPNGVSGHVDHVVVALATTYVFYHQTSATKLMYFCLKDTERQLWLAQGDYFVYVPPGFATSQVNEIVDISAVWDTKVQAMHCHQSQLDDVKFILHVQSSLPKEEYFQVLSR